MADIDRDLIFSRLPPDSGVVTPIAPLNEEPDETIVAQLDKMRLALPSWQPGKVDDPVQRVRNYLFVAAVPDVFQMQELERFIPHVVFDRIQEDIPKDDLIKILYWIAMHPFDGDDSAVDELRPLGLNNGPADMEQTRGRLSSTRSSCSDGWSERSRADNALLLLLIGERLLVRLEEERPLLVCGELLVWRQQRL